MVLEENVLLFSRLPQRCFKMVLIIIIIINNNNNNMFYQVEPVSKSSYKWVPWAIHCSKFVQTLFARLVTERFV